MKEVPAELRQRLEKGLGDVGIACPRLDRWQRFSHPELQADELSVFAPANAKIDVSINLLRVLGRDATLFLGGGLLQFGRIEIGDVEGATIYIGNGAKARGLSAKITGENGGILLGSNFQCSTLNMICAEPDRRITMGASCMLSHRVIVRTSDMHPIYDLASDERLNPAQDVRIGDKVWIGEDVKIMKGASIGRGSVIGSGSIVSGNIGENVIAAGSPAATVRENIRWTRSLPKD